MSCLKIRLLAWIVLFVRYLPIRFQCCSSHLFVQAVNLVFLSTSFGFVYTGFIQLNLVNFKFICPMTPPVAQDGILGRRIYDIKKIKLLLIKKGCGGINKWDGGSRHRLRVIIDFNTDYAFFIHSHDWRVRVLDIVALTQFKLI